MIKHDVLVVGGGLAGLRAAVGLCEHWDVAVALQGPPRPLAFRRRPGRDQRRAGKRPGRPRRLARKNTPSTRSRGATTWPTRRAVAKMCGLAPEVIYELEHWGAPFSRFPDGTHRPAALRRRRLSADLLRRRQDRPRPAAHALRAGRQARRQGLRRVRGDPAGRGGRPLPRTGRLRPEAAAASKAFAAKFCVFATGGYGRMYRNSTNALINTGSGIGMALLAGIPAKDMEFVQFHPTTLFGTNILITEGARGEGGLPAQPAGRAVHGPLRAEGDGAGPARHRRPLHPDRDRRGPRVRGRLRPPGPAAPGPAEDPPAAARHPQHLHRLRRDRSGRRADPHPARPALFDGRHRHRRGGQDQRSTISTPPANAPA